MKNLFFQSILGAAVLIGSTSLQAQTTSYSDVVGYMKRDFPLGTSCHGVGFVLSEKYRGTAVSKSADTLTITGAALTSGQFAPSGALPSHYITITSGDQAGLTADIVSNTANTITVGTGDLAGVNYIPSFVVRPHLKASTLFASSTGLKDEDDTLVVYNSDGTSTSITRNSTKSTGWADPVTLETVDLVIYPGQGFLLNTSNFGNFVSSGVVNPDSVLIPIYSGLVNLVSGSDPSGTVPLQTSNIGTNLEPESDTLVQFSSDGFLSEAGNFTWNGPGSGSSQGFVDPLTLTRVSGVSFAGTDAILINAANNTVWKIKSPLTP
jgi:hypothetical protein